MKSPRWEHEAELAIGGGALVLPDHPAKGILRAFVDAVARHEGEADRARVAVARGGDRAPYPAAGAAVVGEAVPIRSSPARGRRPARGTSSRPPPARARVPWQRRCGNPHLAPLPPSAPALAMVEWPSGPQDYAVIVRIARCDSLGKRRTVLPPYDSRRRGTQSRCPHTKDS